MYRKQLSVMMAACLLLCSGCQAAEVSTDLEGTPWVNSDLYGNWPEERPEIQENYELYVNYEFYQEALANDHKENYAPQLSADQWIEDQMKGLFTDESQTDAEAECLRILYQLFMDHDKREQEGIEPLMKYVSRVKEAETIDELTALLCEDGFLFNASVYDYLVPIPNNSSKGLVILKKLHNLSSLHYYITTLPA